MPKGLFRTHCRQPTVVADFFKDMLHKSSEKRAWGFVQGVLKRRTALGLSCLALLMGCAPGTRAPILDLSEGASPALRPATSSPGTSQSTEPPVRPGTDNNTYVVKPGDTLYGIARATHTSVDSLLRWNDVTDPAQLRAGQVLRLNNPAMATSTKPVRATSKPEPSSVTPRPAQERASPPVRATPKPVPSRPQAAPVPASTATPPVSSTTRPAPAPQPVDAGTIQWAWPASGNVIQAFSATTKGIDIAGASGDPVRAAADGKVMYSGNGVRGLGNLLIINHQGGFITAYAHNRTLLVKAGQEVKRGAKIAELGQTDTISPRLHFEVRRQGTPVNPLQYLPKR